MDEFARDFAYMWRFSTTSVRFHVRKKAAVAETYCAANVHILPRTSARHLELYRVKPIHLDLSAAGGSLWEHERWHISI
jgi:hypothetical protein